MEARVRKSLFGRDWKEVYTAALFEDDNTKIPQRIAEAENALAARALELFGASDDQIREQKAMENARYFLRVLGSAHGMPNASSPYVSQKPSFHSATV
jgi:phosphoribosyl-ATP pyrophosphohydrolase